MRREPSEYSSLCSWGLVLMIQGISTMAMVKVLIGRNLQTLSVAVVVVALLLMIDLRDWREFKKPTRDLTLILFYSLITTVMAMASGIPWTLSPYGFIYQACYLLQILLIWKSFKRIDLEDFKTKLFWFSGGLCVLALVLIQTYQSRLGIVFIAGLGVDSNGDEIITRATTAGIAAITLISCSVGTYRGIARVCRLLFIAVAVAVMAFSNRRTVYVGMLFVYILWARNNATIRNRRNVVGKALGVFGAIGLYLLVYSRSEEFRTTVGYVMDSLMNGIATYLGNRDRFDLAASMRRGYLETLPRQFLWEGNTAQFLFGHGFMDIWVDIPYLQAFWDMGVVGGITYFVLQFIIPMRYLIVKPRSEAGKLCQYYLAMSVVMNLASGLPYGVFVPLVLQIVSYRKEQEIESIAG